MSICVYGRIKRNCIDTELLRGVLAEFFSSKNIIAVNYESCITYEGIGREDIVEISFICEEKPPFNVYDSGITNDEFEYEQLIIFDIDKEEATIERFKEIISFCIYLKGKIDSEILVTSDVHDDICLLTEEGIIWSKNIQAEYLDV